jgi:tetratricopeptide (TPR) repeat protein
MKEENQCKQIAFRPHPRHSRHSRGAHQGAQNALLQGKDSRIAVRMCAVLATLIAAVGLMGAGGSQPAYKTVMDLLRSGKLYRAHRAAVDEMTDNPDDSDLHAAYGAVLSKGGRYADAVDAFELANGSAWYEYRGIPYHASALAELGRSVEAAALRAEYTATQPHMDRAGLNSGLASVTDHLEGGRPDLAVDLAREILLDFPNSPRSFAGLAEALVATGEIDEASWCLLRANALGNTNVFPIQMARIRWLIAMEEYGRAWELHSIIHRKRRLEIRAWADRLELLRLLGDLATCRATSKMKRYAWALDPHFHVQASLCESELGDMEAAQGWIRSLLPAHAAHPMVRARAEAIGMAAEL